MNEPASMAEWIRIVCKSTAVRQLTLGCLGLLLLSGCAASPNAPSASTTLVVGQASPGSAAVPRAATTNPSPSPAASPVGAKLFHDFSPDTVGALPAAFSAPVGYWSVTSEGDNKVLMEDGSQWNSSAVAGVADQAKQLYGDRWAEFLDSFKDFEYNAYVVAKGIDNFTDGTISVRIKLVDGRVDQDGGIIFNVKPTGDFLIMRADAVENNFVLYRLEHGERSVVARRPNVPTAGGVWHDLRVTISGNRFVGALDGQLLLETVLSEPVSGQVGLWAKADTVALFDDFTVELGSN